MSSATPSSTHSTNTITTTTQNQRNRARGDAIDTHGRAMSTDDLCERCTCNGLICYVWTQAAADHFKMSFTEICGHCIANNRGNCDVKFPNELRPAKKRKAVDSTKLEQEEVDLLEEAAEQVVALQDNKTTRRLAKGLLAISTSTSR
jgi:hypothetical protein